MAVVSQTPHKQATANGVTTVFPYDFLILEDEDLAVYLNNTLQALDADYTVSGAGIVSGGSITFITAPPADVIVTLVRDMPRVRSTEYANLGDFDAPVVNQDFDRAILLHQDIRAIFERSIHGPLPEINVSLELPKAADRADKILAFGPDGEVALSELVDLGGASLISAALIGSLLYPTTEAEVLAGVIPVDKTFPEGTPFRYGIKGDNATDDTSALINFFKVGGQGVWLDFGSDLDIVTSPWTMKSANVNVPPKITGSNIRFVAKGGSSGVLCTLENPHADWDAFLWDGIFTFDSNALCSSAFLLHGCQNSHFGPMRFINSVGGPQCRVEAEANFGNFYNTFKGWQAGGTQDEGGNDDGFSIKTTDGTNRTASNTWTGLKSAWNVGHGYDIDRCSDLFVGCEAEKNDGDGFHVDNTVSLTISGGYSEHNNEGMSGGGASDATPDVSVSVTANSSRVMIFGGRHIGLCPDGTLGAGHVILPGQAGGVSITQLGMGFGGSSPVDNGIGFLNTSDFQFRAGGANKFSWRQSTDRMRSSVVHEFQGATVLNIETVTYSASMTPDAAVGDEHVITATNGSAFTINAPSNPATGMVQTYTIRNTSGGALGALTLNAVFKIGAAWTQPANGFSRSIRFRYNGTNWVETYRSAADVSN